MLRNQAISPETLTAAAGLSDPVIRLRVTEHPNTPAELLFDLALDPDPEVHKAACRNEDTPHRKLMGFYLSLGWPSRVI